MFSGSVIPFGWHICDGTNGTPNLRDRFIVGAGSNYAVNSTGGNTSVTLSSSQMPVHAHSLSGINSSTSTAGAHNHTATSTSTVSDPGHSHAYFGGTIIGEGYYPGNTIYATGNPQTSVAQTGISVNTTTTLTPADAHQHTVTLTGNTGNAGGTAAIDITPSYYALYYIMKVI